MKLAGLLTAALIAANQGEAQWINYPSPGAPRATDGSVDTSAPIQRTPDGRPDLSGVWQPAADPNGSPGGTEGIVPPRYLIDIMVDLDAEDVPFQPWAAELYAERNRRSRVDNPLIRCLPAGVPRLDAYTHPYKIIQTPNVVVILYESMMIFRQIFTDGRPLPDNPQPSWMGYSIGRWEDDVLVVETIGFNDQTWLDGSGHPHSEQMRLIERFKRHDIGNMDIEITIEDPVAYTRPITYTQPQVLLPDTDLLEYVCAENAGAITVVP